jgi:hypothetical protein
MRYLTDFKFFESIDSDVSEIIKRIIFYLGLNSTGLSVKKIINSIVERFKS